MSVDHQRSVLFVDLDGTLTMENTFHLLLLAIWRNGSHGERARMGVLAARRVLDQRYRRVQMKRDVLRLVANSPRVGTISARVVEQAVRALSEPVLQVARQYQRAGYRVVLATAAPSFYADRISQLTGLDDCIATSARAEGGELREAPWG